MNFRRINLQLFNDGGAVGGSAESTNVGSSSQQIQSPLSKRQSEQQVIYGKQPDQVEASEGAKGLETTSDSLEARRQEFENLISSDYKDLFSERVQGIIDKRFKETKQLESKMSAIDPIVQMLSDKYGIKGNDLTKLAEAIENDDMYWEEAADEAGLTVEQYKYVKKMERENEAFKQRQQESMREQQIRESWQNILTQSEQLKATYPGFDLDTEFQNPHFQSLIQSGVPVQTAYEVIHMDDIKNGIAQTTAQSVQQQAAHKAKAKAARPSENGLHNQGGITIKNDVTKLTKADRAEIARRVARGEQISY